MTARLQEKYNNEIIKNLAEKFKYDSKKLIINKGK